MDSSRKLLLESWLGIVCKMLPGVKRAVLLNRSETEDVLITTTIWPDASSDIEDLEMAARLASNRQSPVFNVQTQNTSDVSASEIMIAYPLKVLGASGGTVALALNAAPHATEHHHTIVGMGAIMARVSFVTATDSATCEKLRNQNTANLP